MGFISLLLAVLFFVGAHVIGSYNNVDDSAGQPSSMIVQQDWKILSTTTTTTTTTDDEQQQFINCTVVRLPSKKRSLDYYLVKNATNGAESSSSPAAPRTTTTTCALLFFGLAKQFRTIVLPSIQENILKVGENHKCDIYLHNYQITSINNPRANEKADHLDPTEVYDLTDRVVMDTEQDFQAARNMKYYAHPNRKPYRSMGWDKTALVNMYKQWHSIERVWDMMHAEEIKRGGVPYDRVGLFRSDVKYTNPINVMDGEEAVIPKFGFLVNDRMFYGSRDNAHVWAKIRFPSVGCYEPRHPSIKMHSEFFMNDLVLKNIHHVVKKNICFYRVRGNGEVWEDDCEKEYAFPQHLVDLNLTYN